MPEEKKLFLYFDKDEQRKLLDIENSANYELKNLAFLVSKVLGASAKIDFEALIKNGLPFLIKAYRNKYLENLPDHVDFNKIVQSQVEVDLIQVTHSIKLYNSLANQLGKNKPGINTKGEPITNITEETSNKYLNPDKAKYYKYIKEIIPIAMKVDEFRDVPIKKNFICQHLSFKGIKGYGTQLSIDLTYFAR